jgi:hypothetical protein
LLTFDGQAASLRLQTFSNTGYKKTFGFEVWELRVILLVTRVTGKMKREMMKLKSVMKESQSGIECGLGV